MKHEHIKKTRRIASLILLIVAFLITAIITYKAYETKEWNTIAASLAVTVALITVYISLKTSWKNEDDQEPNLLINWDFKSDTIANLIIENVGGGTAYDVKVNWVKALNNVSNKPISFGTIPSLSKNQSVKTSVNSHSNLWKNAKEYGETNDNFSGLIIYKRKIKSKKEQIKEFSISIGHKRLRTDFDNTQLEFYAQGKKIATEFKTINSNLEELIEILKQK